MLRRVAIKTHNALTKTKVDYFLIERVASSCLGIPTAKANINIVIVAGGDELNNLLNEFKREDLTLITIGLKQNCWINYQLN